MPSKRQREEAPEEAFPRGGGKALKAAEDDEVPALFASKPKSKNSRHKSLFGGQNELLVDDGPSAKEQRFVELLKPKALHRGTKLWGCVSVISRDGIVVSVPHGLRVHVDAEELSDTVGPEDDVDPAALFRIGQLVRVCVMDVVIGDRTKVVGSTKPSLQNKALSPSALQPGMVVPASVRSAEDRGYVLDLGMPGCTAFLSDTDARDAFGDEALPPGLVVDALVASVPARKGRAVQVVCTPQRVAETAVTDWGGLTLESLVPGSLVQCKVLRVMDDGIQVSFLEYFTGTIDQFHLGPRALAPDWRSAFPPNTRLPARILFVDAETKRVGLTALPPLLAFQPPGGMPPLGATFSDAIVRRVDKGVGVLVELRDQSGESVGAGYAHISALSDTKVDKIEKLFHVGQEVPCRVTGYRPMDHLCTVSMKKSIMQQSVVSMKELTPGQAVSGVVKEVTANALYVELAPGVKGRVAAMHMADARFHRAHKKFKVGQAVTGLVLGAPSKPGRACPLTLKRALIDSKLPRIVSMDGTAPGTKSHGTVTGIESYGVFVEFFGGVTGLVPTKELGLEPGQKANEAFEVGTVVKARVMSVDAAKGRLRLSLSAKAAAEAAGGPALSPGDVVGGTVTGVERDGNGTLRELRLRAGAGQALVMPTAHLSDHPLAIEALAEAVREGDEFPDLLVLDVYPTTGDALVTRKPALLASRDVMPRDINAVSEGLTAPGYVASVTEEAAFVRFLGRLTGRVPRSHVPGPGEQANPRESLVTGQTVMARVTGVDVARGRVALSLRPSLCAAATTAAPLLASLCRDLHLAAALQERRGGAGDQGGVPLQTFSSGPLRPGSLVTGTVDEMCDYGAVLTLTECDEAIGLVPTEQLSVLETTFVPGSAVRGVVVDVTLSQGLAEVSGRADLLEAAEGRAKATMKGKKKKATAAAAEGAREVELGVGDRVTCRVEVVKPGYAAVSLPATHGRAMALLSTCTLNTTRAHGARLSVGQEVAAEAAVEPSEASLGRWVLKLVPRDKSEGTEGVKKEKGERGKEAGPEVGLGDVADATVTAVHATQVEVRLPSGQVGRVHATEILDSMAGDRVPLEGLTPGTHLPCTVVAEVQGAGSKKVHALELSARPAAVAAAREGRPAGFRYTLPGLRQGQVVEGVVQETHDRFLWVSLSPVLRGRLLRLDASSDPNAVAASETFPPGTPVRCRVAAVDVGARSVDLTLRDEPPCTSLPADGSLVMGAVAKLTPTHALVSLGGRRCGRVGVVDADDAYLDKPLSRLRVGAYVRAYVLRCDEDGARIDLSLRQQHGAAWEGCERPSRVAKKDRVPMSLDPRWLKKGDSVRGWVTEVSKKGVFVALPGSASGRVKLSHLSDGYVEDPAAAFPPGTLVRGKVLEVDPEGRVDIDLRSGAGRQPGVRTLEELSEGEVLWGVVKRVEKYGVFMLLDGTACTGLAHVSECGDGFVRNIGELFQAGKRVRVKVIKVDRDAGRVSLSAKPSVVGAEGGGGAEGAGRAEVDFEDVVMEGDDGGDDGENEASGSEGEGDGDGGSLSESDLVGSKGDGGDSDDDDGGSDDGMGEGESDGESRSEEMGSEEEGGDARMGEESSSGDGSDSGDGDDIGDSDDEDLDKVDFDDVGVRRGVAGEGIGAGGEGEGGGGGEGGEGRARMGSKEKRRKREERERAVLEAERRKVEGDAPASEHEFEALCVASPNSSYIWVRYMAWLLSRDDVARAREVAERALRTISQREESEKFNVWVAYLNLEAQYGGPSAAAQLFQRALPYCEPKKIYMAMLDIAETRGDKETAQDMLRQLCKKFHDDPQAWLRKVRWHLRQSDAAGARQAMERAMQVLPRHRHVEMATQAALLEFREGAPERGRGVMEGILRSYPKRTDIWGVYLDQEVKLGDVLRARALFERAVATDLPPKKMKALFKKYVAFEARNGDEGRVEEVKRKAMEYVARTLRVEG